MANIDASDTALDPTKPIEIAERIWWVGDYLENDAFQCHVYLIEHGNQSVLIDPGSQLTFPRTLEKIRQITSFDTIRYFVCQHPDPDISASLPTIDAMVTRDDAVIVTHWRSEAMLRHFGVKMPFWLVDAHDWRLDLGGRELSFVFTPYAHFPGAICTYDRASGVLFSSDLFSGFTNGPSLFAQDESHFESLRLFHEHYMPSRDVLAYALSQIEALPLRMIAPQHGSIIPEPLIDFMIRNLKTIDCGLYLLAKGDTDLYRLSTLNQVLRAITETMVVYREFGDIASALASIARPLLPVESVEFYARVEDRSVLHLSPESRYRGVLVTPPAHVAAVFGLDYKAWYDAHAFRYASCDLDGGPALLMPLFRPDHGVVTAVAILRLAHRVEPTSSVIEMIEQMGVPLQVAVERETILRTLDFERQRFYERSVRDVLTGLYSRIYMLDTVQRLISLHERDGSVAVVGVLMLDIDHFKSVNDTYGHNQGDVVLAAVADVLKKGIRDGDMPVRLGGEEFAVFTVGREADGIAVLGERLRQGVAALAFDGRMAERTITISGGIAVRHLGEDLTGLLDRADAALYRAKNGGRDRIVIAD
ncbi:MAG: diguanylate cyclase [Alphaproteobacteria bacterium]